MKRALPLPWPVWAALAWSLASACANAPAPREPFPPFQFAREGSAAAAPRRPAFSTAAPSPVRLDAAVIGFAARQRGHRAESPRGQPMPEDVRMTWVALLGDIDRFLRQKPEQSVPLDVVRARVALEAELDLDQAHYAALPNGLAPAVRARALGLSQRLVEVRRLAEPARPVQGPLVWPIEPAVLSSPYGTRRDPFTGQRRRHQGIDLVAEHGQLVQAAGAGVVVRAEWAGGHGLHVEVQHEEGLLTRYSHLSKLLVFPGIRLPAGGPIGLAGSTGRSTGTHLHFEVWRDGSSVDPLTELVDPEVETMATGNLGSD